MNTINLIIGDESNDGHGKTSTYSIATPGTIDDFNVAYNKACNILGFNFITDCCNDYEDNLIDFDIAEKLKNSGIDLDLYLEKWPGLEKTEDGYGVWTDDYVLLYIEIVKLGGYTEPITIINNNEISIGGYGLFY